MEAIIARPATGAKSPVAKKATAKQKPTVPPSRTEGDELALKAAETLRTLVLNVIYDYEGQRREMSNIHIDMADHLLGRLLDPLSYERDRIDPEEGDISAHLELIASEWSYAWDKIEESDSFGSETVPTQVFLAATISHAVDLAHRIATAYEGLPSTLNELRALTTFSGAKPHRDRPNPPIRRSPAASSSPQASPLYPLACAWSEKINHAVVLLKATGQSLKAENPNSPALPLISTCIEELCDNCDAEFELLNALAGLNPALPQEGASTLEKPKAEAVTSHKTPAPSAATQPQAYPAIPESTHDSISAALWRAGTVIEMLSSIFMDEPGLYGEGDLLGLIQHVQWQICRAHEASRCITADVDDLHQKLFEARSLINIVEALEDASHFKFQQERINYCGYFDAIAECTLLATRALELVPTTRKGDAA